MHTETKLSKNTTQISTLNYIIKKNGHWIVDTSQILLVKLLLGKDKYD